MYSHTETEKVTVDVSGTNVVCKLKFRMEPGLRLGSEPEESGTVIPSSIAVKL